jgi:hypothetical protein
MVKTRKVTMQAPGVLLGYLPRFQVELVDCERNSEDDDEEEEEGGA